MTHPLRIAIAGLGTVGASVVSIIQSQHALLRERISRDVQIVAVSARDANKKRDCDLSGIVFETDPQALAAREDVDVVVELMGGAEGAARKLVESALANGKHVVTANKALIATHGAALARKAESHDLSLCFEAAVAGGIPVLKLLREGLAANHITRIMGILNGTCNYILTHMWEEKRTFDDVLLEAQKLGYAEADPSFDVDGIDTSHKLAILTSLAYGIAPDLLHLHVEGIRGITLRDMQFADELGYTIKLLGISSRTDQGILQRVHPCMVAKDSGMASVHGVFNAVQADTHAAGPIFIEGRGAGGHPTASAVIADICDIARGNRSHAFGIRADSLANAEAASVESLETSYYVRLSVIDKPGVLADITTIFKDAGISLKSFIQHGQAAGDKVTVVVATHFTREANMKHALARIADNPSVLETPFSLRIEES